MLRGKPYYIASMNGYTAVSIRIREENINMEYLLNKFPDLGHYKQGHLLYISGCIPKDSDFVKHYKIARLIADVALDRVKCKLIVA